ncbi:MAG TPA: SgcJ/EcaC family oxidoreductase [Anaeromyxobacteraceae bacterium]|nr:SgcJ/EcaC family oxidoreductase [Anaeromyxobacteraceae bacterium]
MPSGIRSRALAAAALLGASPAAAAEPQASEGLDPERVPQRFAEAWNRHDMEAFASLFAEHADFVNVIGLHWRGREEIRRAHAEIHATRMKSSHLAILSTSVRALRPDVALVHATWELVGDTGLEGRPLPPRRGVLSFLATKDGGRWAIEAAQNTDIVPLPNVPPPK